MFKIVRRSSYVKALSRHTQHVRTVFLTSTTSNKESSQESAKSADKGSGDRPSPPPPPSLEMCCMSGCQNCVMIQHAEELLNIYHDEDAARAVVEDIPDESLKAFLQMEMKLK